MDKKEFLDWSFRTFVRVKPPLHLEDAAGEGGGREPDKDDDEEEEDGRSSGGADQLLQFHTVQERGSDGEQVARMELEIPLTAEPGLIHSNTSGFAKFYFNEVFDQGAGQDQVFDSVRDMIIDSFSGINSTILAYGQTGTGISIDRFVVV